MFTVLVCRACCCGTAKHPGFDHDAQLARIADAASTTPGARFRVVGCLDVCSRSNVVVVRDRRPGVAAARRSTWLGGLANDASTTELCTWLASGGPVVEMPDALLDRVFLGPHVDVPADLRDEDCDRPRRRIAVSGA